MIRSRISTCRQPRRGFTLIELLVVISIIAVLVSLIAPAVQAARRTARKLQCLNNVKNIGLAMQAFATSSGTLPYMSSDIPGAFANGTGTIYGAGWPMALLPALDATAVLKNIKLNAAADGVSTNTNGALVNTTEQIWIPVFTCPDDADSDHRPGGLSFVVNAGFIGQTIWNSGETMPVPGTTPTPGLLHNPYYIDWHGGGSYSSDGFAASAVGTGIGTAFDPINQAVAVSAGVFWRPTGAGTNSFQSSLDYLSTGDGQTNTILISENLNAGVWYASSYGSGSSFASVNTIAFGIPIPLTTQLVTTGATGLFTASPYYLRESGGFSTPTSTWTDSWVVNRNLTAPVGTAPRPSSQHSGGVNIGMGDGSSRFLSENVDKIVYAKLLTPNGVSYGETTLDNRGY